MEEKVNYNINIFKINKNNVELAVIKVSDKRFTERNED